MSTNQGPYTLPLRDRVARRIYRLAERVATPCEHDWMEFADYDECFLCGRHQPVDRGSS